MSCRKRVVSGRIMAALSYWLFISRLPVDFGMPSMPAVACLAPGLIDRAEHASPGRSRRSSRLRRNIRCDRGSPGRAHGNPAIALASGIVLLRDLPCRLRGGLGEFLGLRFCSLSSAQAARKKHAADKTAPFHIWSLHGTRSNKIHRRTSKNRHTTHPIATTVDQVIGLADDDPASCLIL